MALKILLMISIVLQLIAAVVAIRLTRVTKYNFSWMLFTFALILLCFNQLSEFIPMVGGKEWELPPYFFAWTGVITSLCLAVGMFYVGKIFNYIQRLIYQRQLTERRILNTVLHTEEKERLRFSKELHDGLGPLLSSAKISLSELAKNPASEEDAELIANTNYVIEEAIRSIREISNNLSPQTLQSFGLARAVNNFINKTVSVRSVKNVEIDFETNLKSERFDTNVEVILYRVICELLNNSLLHSGCNKIKLAILYGKDSLSVFYSDNGKGFDPETQIETGMGLANITSRIDSLGGSVKFTSSRGNGMSADIIINLKQIDERDKKI